MVARWLLAPRAATGAAKVDLRVRGRSGGAGTGADPGALPAFAFLSSFAVDAVYLFPWALVRAGPTSGSPAWSRSGVRRDRSRRTLIHALRRGLCAGCETRSKVAVAPVDLRRPPPWGVGGTRPQADADWCSTGIALQPGVSTSGSPAVRSEFISASMARHDFMRLGVIPLPRPRQADPMIVSGTVTDKMAPAVRRL